MKYIRWALLALLALVCAAAASLWIMGMRDGADSMANRIEIDKPVSVVWAFLEDPAKTKAWVGWLKEIKHLTPGNKGVGAKEIWVMEDRNNGGKEMEINSEVTAFEPLKYVALNLSSNEAFTGTAAYRFEALGANRTAVTVTGTYRFTNGFASFMQPLIMRMAGGKMKEDLQRLKTLAEKE